MILKTRTAGEIELDQKTLDDLKAGLQGTLLTPF